MVSLLGQGESFLSLWVFQFLIPPADAPHWLYDDRIKALRRTHHIYLRFHNSSGNNGFESGVHEGQIGYTTQEDATWTASDFVLNFHWMTSGRTARSDDVPIRVLRPVQPNATGSTTSKLAVVIAGDDLGTVVSVKRHHRNKDVFMVEPVAVGDAGPSRQRKFQVPKGDVCQIEPHGSEFFNNL